MGLIGRLRTGLGLDDLRARDVLALFGAALAIRLLLAVVILPASGHRSDLAILAQWAVELAQNGPGAFYRPDSGYFADYPPVYLYVLWFTGVAGSVLGGTDTPTFSPFVLKLPYILADLAAGWFLLLLVRRIAGPGAGVRAAALFLLNPAVILISTVRGQNDPVATAAVLAAAWLLATDRLEWAAVAAGTALLIKFQYGFMVPITGLVVLRREILGSAARPPDRIRAGMTAAVGAVTILVLCAPFGLWPFAPSDPAHSLVARFMAASHAFPGVTQNAFNLWMNPFSNIILIGRTGLTEGHVVDDTVALLTVGGFQLSAQTIGNGLFAVAVVLALLVLRKRDDALALCFVALAIVVAFFVLPTRIHERYLYPAIALAVPIAIVGRRAWWAVFAAVSAILFLDAYWVYSLPIGNAGPGRGLLADTLYSPAGIYLTSLCSDIVLVWLLWQTRRPAAIPMGGDELPERALLVAPDTGDRAEDRAEDDADADEAEVEVDEIDGAGIGAGTEAEPGSGEPPPVTAAAAPVAATLVAARARAPEPEPEPDPEPEPEPYDGIGLPPPEPPAPLPRDVEPGRSRLPAIVPAVIGLGLLAFLAAFWAARIVVTSKGWLWNLDMPKIDYPLAVFAHEALTSGHLPLWNDRLGLGYPLYAEGQIGAFYPPNWLLFQLQPITALDVSRVLHLAFAGLGAGLLVLRIRGSRAGAVIALLVAVLGGGITAKLEWYNLVAAYAYLPWVLLPLVRRPRPTRAGLVVAGLLYGLQALAGHPNTWLLTGIVAGLILLAGADGRIAGLRRALGMGLLGAGIAAIQLIPTALLTTISVRSNALSPNDLFASASTPFDILAFAFAGAFTQVRDGAWYQFGIWYPDGIFALLEVAAYVGLPVLGLAVAGARLRRSRPFLLAIAVLIAIPVVEAFRPEILLSVPLLNGLRSPDRTDERALVRGELAEGLAGVGGRPEEHQRHCGNDHERRRRDRADRRGPAGANRQGDHRAARGELRQQRPWREHRLEHQVVLVGDLLGVAERGERQGDGVEGVRDPEGGVRAVPG
ncbi:MAG: hypothetical protein WCK58_11695, partial [Chloroflexota bacterium]